MKKVNILFIICVALFWGQTIQAQGVGVNEDNSSPNASAMLDVKSTTKGMLIPRMQTGERTTIPAPATSLLVFDTDTNSFWFFNGTIWVELRSGTDNDNQDLTLAGNTLSLTNDVTTVDLSGYLDNTDNQNLSYNATTGVLTIQNGNSVNLATGDILEVIAGTGLTGGGTTGSITVNAVGDNGLTTNADDIDLGGALNQPTTITQGANNMTFNLDGTGDFLIQDNGVSKFTVRDDGTSRFGGNVQWRTPSVNGGAIAELLEDAGSGRFRVYEGGNTTVDLDANTGFIFNEQGLDRDFRVEADANSNMLFVDAGNNRVGIGIGNPSEELHVLGDARITGLGGSGNALVLSDNNGVLSNTALTGNTTDVLDGTGNFVPIGSISGDITDVTAGAGLIGGGATGAVTVTANANNGLNVDAGADAIQLGGALVEATTITQGANNMTYNLNGAGDFRIQDNGTNQFVVQDNGDVRADNTTLYVDASTNRVGIGTNVPSAMFSVGNETSSGLAGTTGGNQMVIGGTHNTGVNLGGNKLYIGGYDNDGSTVYPLFVQDENLTTDFWLRNRPSAAGLPTMYFAGNTGLGTTTPAEDLHVFRGDADIARVYATGTTQGSGMFYAGQSTTYGGGFVYDGDGTPALVGGTDRVTFFRRTNGVDTDVMSYAHNNSTVRIANLAGTGNRVVVANAAGDLSTQTIASMGDNLGNHAATTTLDMNSNQIQEVSRLITLGTSDYDKLRVYSSANYTIGMHSAMSFGYLNDWAMTFTMNQDNDRGWVWRDVSDAQTDGAASLTTDGRFVTKSILESQGQLIIANDATIDGTTFFVDASENNVGVGTLNLDRNFHLVHDQFTGATNFGGLQIEQTSNGNQWTLYTSQSTNDLRLYYNNANRGNFDDVSGNYAATSDIRLKKNIEYLGSTMNRIMKLRPAEYHYKSQTEDESKIAGFIAQEVKEVFPTVVKVQVDDTNGHDIADLHLLSYTELLPYMVKGMQEQQEIIENQNKKIESQQAKLDAMQQKMNQFEALLKGDK